MAGINIPFLSNVRDFLRGTGDVEGALGDVADSLDDVGRDAQAASRDAERALDDVADAGTRAGDDIRDGARDAEDALQDVARQASKTGSEIESEIETGAKAAGTEADKMEKSFKDAFDTVSKKAKDAGDDIDKNTRVGTVGGSEAVGEFKDEAISNFSEVASSFSGDMTSAVDLVQGTLGGLASGLKGAAGIASGVAAIAFGALFARATAAAEKTRERIDRIKQALTETESVAQATDEVWRETIEEWGDPVKMLGDDIVAAQDNLKAMGFTAREADTIIRGIAGAPEEIRRAQELLNREIEETDRQWRRQGGGFDVTAGSQDKKLRDVQGQLTKTAEEIARGTREYELQDRVLKGHNALLDETSAITEEAAAAQESMARALEATADPVSTYEELLSRKTEADRAAAEATAAATKDSSDSWTDYTSKVKVSTADLIREWNKQAERARNFEKNLATIAKAGGQALADELRAKGPEVAGAVAEVIAEAGPKRQRQAIEAHAAATGQDLAQGIADGAAGNKRAVHESIGAMMEGLPVGQTTVKVKADLTDAKRDIARWNPIVTIHPRNGKQVR